MSDLREKTAVQIEDIEKETRAFDCPNCGYHMQFRLSVKVNTVQRTLSGEEAAERDGLPEPRRKLTPEEANPPMGINRPQLVRLGQYYRDIGITSAFESVVKELMAHQLPPDMNKFFLTWLTTTTKASLIPKLALQRLINEFRGEIGVYHAQGIGAVVSNGQLRCFVAMHLLRGEIIRAGNGSNTKLRTRATDERLDAWIKTKHGYVYGKGLLFTEMQKQAKGSFENVR